MKTNHKRRLSFLLALLLAVTLLLPGCAPDNTELRNSITYEGYVTLQVVIDAKSTALFNNVLEKVVHDFEDSYENVTVEVVTVTDLIKEYGGMPALREAVEAGEGPDIFILETDIYPSTSFDQILFPDVNQAMRDGLFANLTLYYDLDEELDRKGLIENVMDAGMASGYRFALPLTYDYPVMFVDIQAANDAGLEEADFENGVIPMLDAIAALGEPQVAACAKFCEGRYFFNFFPELVDYDTQEVLLDRDELIAFLNSYLAYRDTRGYATPFSVGSESEAVREHYVQHKKWLQLGECMRAGWSLGDVLLETEFAKHNGTDMKVYPMTGPDGKIVAEVRQFGAVNAGCENVGLAYMFLREFLTEDGQWVQNTGARVNFNGHSMLFNRLAFHGYPVRTKGSVEALYNGTMKAHYQFAGSVDPDLDRVYKELAELEVKESDIPILKENIDVARFPAGALEWKFALNTIIEFEQGGWNANAVDVEALVDAFLEELEFYLAG